MSIVPTIVAVLRHAVRWTLPLLLISSLTGAACAFFLWILDAVTSVRFANPWLIFLLPLAGVAMGWIIHKIGRSAEAGNNLIIDEIHEPIGRVPRRIAPLILFGTLVTHLVGGSAGREGTAVQMGGGIAGTLCKVLRLHGGVVPVLLMGGVAAGFGAVFGTPLAGAIFAMEVLTRGRIRYQAAVPCLIAAFVADRVCHACGAVHTAYAVNTAVTFSSGSMFTLGRIAVAAIAFGLAGKLFALASHGAGRLFKCLLPFAPLRLAVGGALVVVLYLLAGTPDFLGLGVWSRDAGAVTIPACFNSSQIAPWSWLWKAVFTIITLGAGFKGGEVTPLFFIGAALGNALSTPLGGPLDLFAACGFAAIFAAATKTPLACTVMGMELFGARYGLHLGVACYVAFAISGRTGIYSAQREPATR
ncbi:MAG: Voltage-gated ClC-type chloride channel ClcB [Verrucomicrobiota bacterium]|jgi:H+/Cl- antiporter ClcA